MLCIEKIYVTIIYNAHIPYPWIRLISKLKKGYRRVKQKNVDRAVQQAHGKHSRTGAQQILFKGLQAHMAYVPSQGE